MSLIETGFDFLRSTVSARECPTLVENEYPPDPHPIAR